MRFKAVGSSLVMLPSGMLQIGVEFFRDDEETPVLSQVYIVTDRAALVAKVTAQLAHLKTVEDLDAQQLNIIGFELGSI